MKLNDFINDPSLVLYLPLGNLDGAQFMDRSAYGHTCTVTGATWGLQGRTFDGSDDKLSLDTPAALNFGAGSFTIIVWAYYATAAADKPYFASTDAGSRRRIDLRSNGFSREATVGGILERTFTPVSAGWHQIVGVYDSVAQTLEPFVDAVSKGTTGSVTGTLADATENTIGRSTAINVWLAGMVAEVWLYNRAFSFVEIQRLNQATKWRYQ